MLTDYLYLLEDWKVRYAPKTPEDALDDRFVEALQMHCHIAVSYTHLSCAYNMDNCCVELKFNDGSMIAIDTIAVENEVARNRYERSELDYLIFNAPLEYADLIWNGDPETYLRTVTEYKNLD